MKLEKFDYQIKDNKKNKSVIILGITVVALLAGFIIYKSFASYKVTETYNIIKGSVAEFTVEPLKISYNLVGEDGEVMSTNEIPSNTEYEYDSTKSSCENGNKIEYNKENNTITIGDGSEALEDTCNIYFNYIPLAKQTLYALGYTSDDIKTGIPYGNDEEGEDGFYAAPDNYGTSYYYYAAAENERPAFLIDDYYFLIRINGDGSLRLISWDTIYNSRFIDEVTTFDNAHVGYMYGAIGANDYALTHQNTNSSYIINRLNQHFADSIDSSLLADNLFCNDRTLYKSDYGDIEAGDTAKGYGTETTYYGSYYRLKYNKPSLMCERKEDSFTYEDTVYGNGLNLGYAGLPTADEIYMTNPAWYADWIGDELTMSPAAFKDNTAYVYSISSITSSLKLTTVVDRLTSTFVVNIKPGLTFTGSGVIDDEFIIVE